MTVREPCTRSATHCTMPQGRTPRDRPNVIAAIAVVAALIGIGFGPRAAASQDVFHEAGVVRTQVFTTPDLGVADARRPAMRSPVKAVLTTNDLPAELSATIGESVTTIGGCTLTRVDETMITAAHCHPFGFTVEGDIAWSGAAPVWVDPASIPVGSTVYGVGYPQATSGPQTYTLTYLGLRTVRVEGAPVDVLMAVGDGVPCTVGSSGMIAWVTVDNEMEPIGPMSVYSVDPAVTGLPAGQYVCGFAI